MNAAAMASPTRTLNLFYEEPDPDRYFPFDRYPRRVLRRLLRGEPRPGGQARVFLNLCAGLDRIGVRYRVNDYAYASRNPSEPVCIIGKPHVLDKVRWKNPIFFGAGVFSHPLDDLHLFRRLPIVNVIVPGEWMRRMFEPFYGDKVVAWPVGIDTEAWAPRKDVAKDIDVLVYDKVRWRHDEFEGTLLGPLRATLRARGLRTQEIRYGFYEEEDFARLLARSRSMLFVCEHETQGIAYQQTLACGVPILAWDRKGFWQDPTYYPERVRFEAVSTVPYWDTRCGETFEDASDFAAALDLFWRRLEAGDFSPRDYILENLTLESCARRFVDLVTSGASVRAA